MVVVDGSDPGVKGPLLFTFRSQISAWKPIITPVRIRLRKKKAQCKDLPKALKSPESPPVIHVFYITQVVIIRHHEYIWIIKVIAFTWINDCGCVAYVGLPLTHCSSMELFKGLMKPTWLESSEITEVLLKRTVSMWQLEQRCTFERSDSVEERHPSCLSVRIIMVLVMVASLHSGRNMFKSFRAEIQWSRYLIFM